MGTIDPQDSPSPVRQLSLSFEPGLTQRFRDVRSAMASGVYKRGLERVAGRIDMSPSKLTEKLGGGLGDRKRDIVLMEFERYLDETGDLTPVLYLVEKYLGDSKAMQQEALAKLAQIAEQLPAMLAAAGLGNGRSRK